MRIQSGVGVCLWENGSDDSLPSLMSVQGGCDSGRQPYVQYHLIIYDFICYNACKGAMFWKG